jgi:hypothetical protein
MKRTDFREKLIKIMPGYSWTVHNPLSKNSALSYMEATGIQTAGFNRLSTLQVVRRDKDGTVSFEVKSAGFGLNARWLSSATGKTLASALRTLQNHYENVASNYASHGRYLAESRKPVDQQGES